LREGEDRRGDVEKSRGEAGMNALAGDTTTSAPAGDLLRIALVEGTTRRFSQEDSMSRGTNTVKINSGREPSEGIREGETTRGLPGERI
jgi:hypothetical protein